MPQRHRIAQRGELTGRVESVCALNSTALNCTEPLRASRHADAVQARAGMSFPVALAIPCRL
jgi:hypothetical protein